MALRDIHFFANWRRSNDPTATPITASRILLTCNHLTPHGWQPEIALPSANGALARHQHIGAEVVLPIDVIVVAVDGHFRNREA